MPAKAGIQCFGAGLDSRVRGNDEALQIVAATVAGVQQLGENLPRATSREVTSAGDSCICGPLARIFQARDIRVGAN
jgi:hypothetical protein